MHDIAELKHFLPLDRLMAKLGLLEHAQKKAFCPFHEDGTRSFSVYPNAIGELHWKCFAGCGQGDAIDFLKVMFTLETKKAIERYADLAGMGKCQAWDAVKRFQGKVVPFSGGATDKDGHVASKVRGDEASCRAGTGEDGGMPNRTNVRAVPEPAKLEPLSDKTCIKIAEWRGLKPETVADMSDKGIIGLYNKCPAFSTVDGVQYRLKDGSWRYSDGAKVVALVLGPATKDNPWGETETAYVVESCWDALALYESLEQQSQVICTRGASNAKVALDYISPFSYAGAIVAIPHNDEHGEKWLRDLKAGLMLHNLHIKRVPAAHKDFNEFYKFKKQQEKDWIGEGNNG